MNLLFSLLVLINVKKRYGVFISNSKSEPDVYVDNLNNFEIFGCGVFSEELENLQCTFYR